jgi:adenylate cyclase
MARLIVNPGRKDAWEIPLREGVNSLGRGKYNHFQINERSVSTSHCHVVVNHADVMVRDLGSTNGTFVHEARVKEAHLQPGQRLRLGGVELLLDTDAPESPPPPLPPAPPDANRPQKSG